MWPCYVLSCDIAWNTGCTVTFHSLSGDVLGVARWTVGARAPPLPPAMQRCVGAAPCTCNNGEEIGDCVWRGLALKAESFLRQKEQTPDSSYHIKLLYKGVILREEWLLSGLPTHLALKLLCLPISPQDLVCLQRSR